MRKIILLTGLCIILVLATLSTANAAPKPKNSILPGNYLRIASGSQMYFGGAVSFTYNFGQTVKSPRVQVVCTQNGRIVYGEARPAGETFVLGGASSPWWTSPGPASCVATLYYWDFSPIQTMVALALDITFSAADPRSR